MPFFSVIIPLYNKELFIENTLRSVLAQTFSDFEIIVIDNGSTDKSAEKVFAFDDLRIRCFSKANEGVSTARNYGLALATADYITFLDADDYWYPKFLQTMKQNIESFPGHRVFSAAIEIETSKSVFPAQYSVISEKEIQVVNYFEASKKETVICTSCAVFHKTVFDTAGVFDPTMTNSEDIDLWIRIGLEFKVVFSLRVLARYVYDPNSLSKNKNQKVDFSKYAILEKENPLLKQFLDLNRFSMAIKSKINGDNKSFQNFRNDIDLEKLSLKKRILLELPGLVLRKLVGLREKLADMGLSNSVFK